jgi:glycosyltransferase involved in cell wall biosynthesis
VTARPARVVYVNSAADVGGGEKWMLALADGLDRARYASAFVVAHEGPFADAIRARGFPVTVVDLTRLASVRTLIALTRHFRRARPDLVHTAGARASFYGRVAAWLAGVPAVVSSVHTSIEDYEVPRWRRALYGLLDRASARIAARLIATSEAVGATLRRRGAPAGKVVVIPNRPDPRHLVPLRARAAVRAELGAGGGDTLIGVIARLTPQKGVGDFLDALARLRDRGGWRAAIVGDGPLRADLEARARRLGIADRCAFAGMRTDLGDLLAGFDVLAVPSRSEGLPYLVLEAMTAGTPMVATAVGGIPEAVTDGVSGLLVPAREPGRLAAALGRLLDDPRGRAALAAAARRHAAEALSLEPMLAAVDAVYRAVLGEAARGVSPGGAVVAE